MPDTNPLDTLDTNASELRHERFEAAWLAWRAGEMTPCWRQHLPADEELCSPDLVFFLLQLDIECRVKAGLPALLAERYFEHPRLQRQDACLDAERQVELICWEYQQRWNKRDPAHRAEYEAVFPQHAVAVRGLKPCLGCPQCRRMVVLDETWQTFTCPDCGTDAALDGHVLPSVPQTTTTTSLQFDSRAYQLAEQLGKGGMGEVYRASDPALGRDLAIKVMKNEYRQNAEAERRFLREARVTGSLQHPGIVPVHNLGRLVDGRLHYTMRLVRGQTLADILKDEAGKLERLPSLLGIFEKICQAVAYAHSKRVIHRDLKPANIMVGRFGEVQVMDWGLAKVLTTYDNMASPAESSNAVGTVIWTESAEIPSELSRAGKEMGTPAYMPPEQAQGEWKLADERADVFGLGAILCEILTCRPPYADADSNEVLRQAKHGDLGDALARLDRCGQDDTLVGLCKACLKAERVGRPQNAGKVAEYFAAYQTQVREQLQRAKLERVAAETRAQEAQARAETEAARVQEAQGRVRAERLAKRRLLILAGTILLLFVGGLIITLEGWAIAEDNAAKELAAKRQAKDEASRATNATQLAIQDLNSVVVNLRTTLQDAEWPAAKKAGDDWLLVTMKRVKGIEQFLLTPGTDRDADPEIYWAIGDLFLLAASADIATDPSPTKEWANAALRYYKRASEIAEKLNEANRQAEKVIGLRVISYAKLADAHMQSNQPFAASHWYHKALDLEQHLTNNAESERITAVLQGKLGDVCFSREAWKEAESHYRECYQRIVEIARMDKSYSVQRDLAVAHGKLADVHCKLEQWSKARERYRDALEIRTRLVQSLPLNDLAVRGLWKPLYSWGLFKQPDATRPEVPWWYYEHLRLAEDEGTLKGLPQDSRWVVTLTQKLTDAIERCSKPKTSQESYQAARDYLLCMRALTSDHPSLSSPNRKDKFLLLLMGFADQEGNLRRIYSGQAINCLRQAVKGLTQLVSQNNSAVVLGIQQQLTDWRNDPNLAFVRDRPALDRLPLNERTAWQALWHDVDELLKRVAKPDKIGVGRAKSEETKNIQKDSRK